MTEIGYVAFQELELFAGARGWKEYFSAKLVPFLAGHVLEVGAGRGDNVAYLLGSSPQTLKWTCLEPDRRLAGAIVERMRAELRPRVEARVGTLEDLASTERFDALIYVDVLEHIEKDGEELQRAAAHLTEGGRLIVLSPAHQSLFSPFDAAVGHFRRYSRATLAAAAPAELRLEKIFYLDSVGLFASLANKLFLKQKHPTVDQVKFWSDVIVPVSRWIDPLLGFRVGKSVVGVWSKASLRE